MELVILSMEDENEYSTTNLQQCSYRLLQQTAKNMGLPSNVKKIYLIQLIYTKKNRSQEEVDNLVKQVRLERKQLALVRKKAMRRKRHVQQSTEISSTSNSESPPIGNTPKQVGHILIRYSPELHSPLKYPQKMSARSYPLTCSDRVLRSYKRVKKPTYLLNNTLLGLINASGSEERCDTRVNIVKEEKFQTVNRAYVRRRADGWSNGDIVPVPRTANVATSPLVKVKRQRRVSGIYPLNPEDVKPRSVSVRRADGTLSKLNAIIQKPLMQHDFNYDRPSDSRNQSLLCLEAAERPHSSTNMVEIASSMEYRANMPETAKSLNFRVPTMSEIAHNLEYRAPNVSVADFSQNNLSLSSSSEEMNVSHPYKENHSEDYAVYYHKKIRAEQVRSLRSREPARFEAEGRLPKINEVFSKFNSVYCRDVTQPIYVQVDREPEMIQNTPYIPDPRVQYQGTSTLEKMYNLKSVLINQPLLQIYTTSNTRTVYSTPVISTAKAQPSSTAVHNFPSSSRDSQPYFTEEEIPRVQDFFRNFRCEDENIHDATTIGFSRSSSSVEALNSQELGANVTIPEMVEDALELISQDGDYMERIGMDIRMQCILCNWAGPKIILEYHIRKDHSAEIIQCDSDEWCVTYTLGSLASHRLWLSQVLELSGTLYVLSAKYEDPDCFMATLSTLSSDPDSPKSGRMTIYNKVTGEPFTWEGAISPLPPSMPYDNDPNCFKLQLTQMDLLPNSANLKLLNRELVIHSPTKVVVGQPELDNIHIGLIVKILE